MQVKIYVVWIDACVCRLTTEVDSEGLPWLQTNIDEVITMLQQSSELPLVPSVN